jgi:hypothetical protein
VLATALLQPAQQLLAPTGIASFNNEASAAPATATLLATLTSTHTLSRRIIALFDTSQAKQASPLRAARTRDPPPLGTEVGCPPQGMLIGSRVALPVLFSLLVALLLQLLLLSHGGEQSTGVTARFDGSATQPSAVARLKGW